MNSSLQRVPARGRAWSFCSLCWLLGLAGCQGAPILDGVYVPASAAKAEHPTIVVFEETETTREAVKQTVLNHLPPGMPLPQARAALEQEGFTCTLKSQGLFGMDFSFAQIPLGCLSPQSQRRLAKERGTSLVYCQATRIENTSWHLRTDRLLIVLIPDESNNLRDVEVGIRGNTQTNADFFQAHPEMRDPLGLPLPQAQAQMESASFACQLLSADQERKALHCERYAETIVGGRIIRVNLYPDDAGVIRDTKVSDKSGWFDAERCMLPHQDDTVAQAVLKGAAFPVRAGCRYTLETAGFLLACCLFSYGLH